MYQDCSLNQFFEHTETVESLMARFNTFELMMFGDYNFAGFMWSINCDLSYNIVHSPNHNITDQTIYLVLARKKFYTLDLLFSNFSDVHWEEPLEDVSKTDAHHSPSIFVIDVQCDSNLRYSELFRNFMKANYEGINTDLPNVDWSWSSMYDAVDCESKLDKFYSIINKTIEDHVSLYKRDHPDFPSCFRISVKLRN